MVLASQFIGANIEQRPKSNTEWKPETLSELASLGLFGVNVLSTVLRLLPFALHSVLVAAVSVGGKISDMTDSSSLRFSMR